MSLSRILKGTHSRDIGRLLFWSPNGFSGLGIATINALLQIVGIFGWRMQELRKSQNRDLRADPAWSINSEKMESSPGDFPGFRRLRVSGICPLPLFDNSRKEFHDFHCSFFRIKLKFSCAQVFLHPLHVSVMV